MMMNVNDLLLKEAHLKMDALLKTVTEAFDSSIEFSINVDQGHLLQRCQDFIKENPTDLIVIVSKKRKGIDKLVDRQKSLRCIGEVTIPLLIIPFGFPLTQIKTIGLALDKKEVVNESDAKNLQQVISYFGSTLKPFHVNSDKNESLSYLENESLQSVSTKKVDVIFDQNVENGIEKWCENQKVDLLCMVTHNKGVFSKTFVHSVIRTLVKRCELPILILTHRN